MRSSYAENNFGSVFRALILAQMPKVVLEFGVLDGYSTFFIASALRFNEYHRNQPSVFYAYDLWEGYEYNHGDFDKVKKMLQDQHIERHVKLYHGDAFTMVNNVTNDTVDFLHIDISNDGDILEYVLKYWGPKMTKSGIIAFEGGSAERDKVEWMIKYKKKPIAPLLVDIHLSEEWAVQTFPMYPSMTLFFKRNL